MPVHHRSPVVVCDAPRARLSVGCTFWSGLRRRKDDTLHAWRCQSIVKVLLSFVMRQGVPNSRSPLRAGRRRRKVREKSGYGSGALEGSLRSHAYAVPSGSRTGSACRGPPGGAYISTCTCRAPTKARDGSPVLAESWPAQANKGVAAAASRPKSDRSSQQGGQCDSLPVKRRDQILHPADTLVSDHECSGAIS